MTARMTFEINPINKQNTAANREGIYADSSSDDGSEISLGDACVLMEDGVDNEDNYNAEHKKGWDLQRLPGWNPLQL